MSSEDIDRLMCSYDRLPSAESRLVALQADRIRSATIEECALEAEKFKYACNGAEIAKAIRALNSKQKDEHD